MDNVFELLKNILDLLGRALTVCHILLFMVNTTMMTFILAGLAHFADEKRQPILMDVRNQMLKFLENFVVGINCLIDGQPNGAFKEHTMLESQKENNFQEQLTVEEKITTSTPSRSSLNYLINAKATQPTDDEKNVSLFSFGMTFSSFTQRHESISN